MPTQSVPLPVPPRRLLIVEDDRPSRVAMMNLLRSRGFEVRGAATLGEGRRALLDPHWRPDCLVLDLMLPDGSGADLLAAARQLDPPPAPCVAVVTATSDPNLLDAVRRLGPDLLLRKPIDFDQLAEFLERH